MTIKHRILDGVYRKDSNGVNHSLIWTNFDYLDLPEFRTQSEIFSSNTVIGNDADTGSANKISLLQNYSYDGNSFITGITTQRTQNSVTTTKTMQYSYDEAGQLIRVNDEAGNRTYTYKYDAGGNISEKKEYSYTTGTLGTPTLTIPYLYGDANWKDKLTAYNGNALTYTTNGYLSTYNGWTYTWQAGRQLAGMSKAGTTIGYTYNASGLRTSKTVNDTTTNYTLVGSQITHEKTGTEQMDYYYDGNGQLVSIFYSGNMYYYLHNLLGEITGLVDGNGNLVVEYTYDPYGKVLTTTGTLANTLGGSNPFRYKDYYLDGETGLYYLQSRYYSPEWGRFISSDDTSILLATQGELPGGNLFAYCGNCPVMGSDPSGYISFSWVKGPFGVKIGFNILLNNIETNKLNGLLNIGAGLSALAAILGAIPEPIISKSAMIIALVISGVCWVSSGAISYANAKGKGIRIRVNYIPWLAPGFVCTGIFTQ